MKTDQEIRTDIMNTLIECRTEKGVSQAELAKIIEKSPTAVASWEQGLSLPSPQMLYRLSQYYGKTIEYMYGERNEEGKDMS